MAIEAKPFASLSSGLLARKGAARPAMRPQGFGQTGSSPEDLGWDDMGFEPTKLVGLERDAYQDSFGDEADDQPRIHHPTGLTPVNTPVSSPVTSPMTSSVTSPVHDQQSELADRLNGVANASANDGADDSPDEELDDTAELYVPEEETALPTAGTALFEPTLVSQPEPLPFKPVAKAVSTAPRPTASPIAGLAASATANPTAPRPRAAPGSKGKAAFTLRLDPDRHLKLRLACAVDGRSAQQLVTAALDRMLERMPELNGLAAKAKSRG